MALDKVSDNGILLYGLDLFRSQISTHTLKLDLPKSTPLRENIRQWPLKRYQTMTLCYMVLDIFTFQISIHRLELDLPKRDSPLRKCQTMAFCDIF